MNTEQAYYASLILSLIFAYALGIGIAFETALTVLEKIICICVIFGSIFTFLTFMYYAWLEIEKLSVRRKI